MKEDDLQLPDFLIADLYKNSLVIADNEPGTVEKKPEKVTIPTDRQWFLGSNLRNITLLVHEKDAVYLKDDALQFLSSILGACQLNLGDVAIVNHFSDPMGYPVLKEKLRPAFLIAFGIPAQALQLPFTIPNYQIQNYDQCQFLLSMPLESMLQNTQDARLEKSKLWLCLKKMFAV
ncbi:MAG: hypothetical protein KGO92_08000 [Bacteroidota bacterium]|nr:hypothetical protein [Bacteroidota bacterium]